MGRIKALWHRITGSPQKIRNSSSLNPYEDSYEDPFSVPRNRYKTAIRDYGFRESLRVRSEQEDDINSYYTNILNTVSEACVGTTPMILGAYPIEPVNDAVEDRWLEWCIVQGIGAAFRECRRDAAKYGIGIMVPYLRQDVDYAIKLSYKNIPPTDLQSPVLDVDPDLDIQNGVEFNENGDIVAIYVCEKDPLKPTRYTVPDQAIVWHKKKNLLVPECGPAFCLFPSIRRYMNAIVRGEEYRQSIALAVSLDPLVYKPEDATVIPNGSFEYEPGMVPTLPPGTKLEGINVQPQANERNKYIELVIGAAARCKNMPKNIALGDSSNHNMASAQIDIEPWKNTVEIDRFDFEPVPRQVFKKWYEYVVLVEGYLPQSARVAQGKFTYNFNYRRLYSHPDPNKKASARLTDLISGSTTLYQIHTEEGNNPRRVLDREARLMGISREELNKMYLGARSFDTLQALKLLPQDTNEQETTRKE